MNVLVLGYSKSGKTTAAEMVAEMIGSNPPKNCSDYIIEDFCDTNDLDPNFVKENKDEFRKRLLEFGISKQNINPAYPVDKALTETDVVTGVRTPENLKASRPMFDIVLWIDRENVPKGKTDKISKDDADVVIDNNGSFDQLRINLMSVLQ